MLITVTKEDLVNMLCGISPSYEQMGMLNALGTYSGSYDRWNWCRSSVEKLPEDRIYALYQKVMAVK